MSQLQVTGEAKIRDIQGPVVANSGVITALDGAASQYVRGDGTLADFPTSTGGGSSVSYYLNSSVSQGTIGGVAYRELSKDPIIGAGTDITISANGYVANYITDANDPDVTIVPGGNFNCEFYFSVNNNTGNPTTYAELYKYDGTTFTLLGTSAGVPESINQGTTIAPYYFAIPVATAALSVTDRLAIRIYVSVDGRTVTLHTENGHLCQVVTTLSKGMVSLNNLTDQSQYLATGTSGTDFNIVSSGDTHTFNIPSASNNNRGLITNLAQTIGGIKTFSSNINADSGIRLKNGVAPSANGYVGIGSNTQGLTLGVYDSGSAYYHELYFPYTNGYEYTFPSTSGTLALTSNLSAYVPYTGATNSVDLGAYSLSADTLNGVGIFSVGSGTQSGFIGIKQGTTFLGNISGYNSINANATKFILTSDVGSTNYKSASFQLVSLTNNTERTYTLPDLSGTLALLEGTQTFSGSKTFSANPSINAGGQSSLSILSSTGNSALILGYVNNILKGTIDISATEFKLISAIDNILKFQSSNNFRASLIFSNSADYSYTFPAATGTIALTSDLSGYVTLATNQTISGNKTFTGNFIASNYAEFSLGGLVYFNGSQLFNTGISFNDTGSPSIFANAQAFYVNRSGTTSTIVVRRDNVSGSSYMQTLSFSNNAANRTYTFPDANGTIALTSNLSAYLPLTGGTLTGALSGTSATFSGTLTAVGYSKFWNGTTGLLVGAFSAGAGYGAIYSTGVTPSTTNFALASNGASTSINATNDLSFSINNTTTALAIASTGAATFSSSSANHLTLSGGSTVATRLLVARGTDDSSQNLLLGWNSITVQRTSVPLSTAQTDFSIIQQGSDGSRTPFYISSGGNVGIGTSSPADKLEIQSGYLRMFDPSSTTGAGYAIRWSSNNGGSNVDYANIDAVTTSAGNRTGDLLFRTANAAAPAERMRITSSGDVFIGFSSSSGNKFAVSANGTVPAIYINSSGGIGSYYFGTGAIYSNGGILTNTNPSDSRLKDNIEDIQYGLDDILKLRPVKYTWKDDKIKQGFQFGFIAQEVQEVMPEAIKEFGEDVKYLGLEKDAIYATLVKAVQESFYLIKELQDKIVTLESKIN